MKLRVSSACLTRPVFGFLSLVGIAAAIAAAKGTGIIDAALCKRAIGVDIGLMIVLMGNFLPKLRLLNSPGSDPVEGAAAELAAGWILVLSGLAYINLSMFAPLDLAGRVSSLIAISALVAIAVNWVWLKRDAIFRAGRNVDGTALSKRAADKRKVAVWLFFAFVYVLVSASVVALFGDAPRVRELGSWIVLGFGMAYAVLYAVLEESGSSRAARHSKGDRPQSRDWIA